MSDPGIGIAGYGIARVCSQPVSVVTRLSAPKLARLCDELADLRCDWRDRAPQVADGLTAVVPLLGDRFQRREVLALRRRLHRAADVSAAEIDAVLHRPGMPAVPGAAELGALAALRDDLARRLEDEYGAALDAEQRVLASLVRDGSLRAGAQLSADGLLHNMDRYADAVAGGNARDKRARATESTLVNLVARSALKPSPFGRLVHTHPIVFEDRSASGQAPPLPGSTVAHRSVCRLPRQLVNWVERCLADHPGLRSAAVLRRAPVAGSSDKGVVFLVRGRDGTHEPAARERLVRVPPAPAVAELLTLQADVPVPERELLARFAALPGESTRSARSRLDALIERGVLARDLGVGEQAAHPIARLTELLPPDCEPRLRECATGLAAAESAFEKAGIDRRQELIARIQRHVTDLADLCGVPTPPIEAARTLIYEDTVVAAPRPQDGDRWRRHLPALSHWHRLLPIFDDGAHVRTIIADLVREAFGPGPHRLLSLFTALSSAKLQELIAQRLTDLSAPVPARLRDLQNSVFDLADAGDGVESVVDPRRAAEIAEDLPPWIPRWPRVSWHVQHHTSAGEDLLVVNGGAIGFGRAISRFLPAYAAVGDQGFTELVKREISGGDLESAPLTDLSAVLGINANVHPPLLGAHLRYPCSTPEEWGGGRGISLEDCWAEVDAGSGRLLLRNGRDGHPMRFVPLNFLLNELAPRFYQFLGFFSLGGMANLAWWDRVDQRRGPSDGVRRYPRVRSGNLILARRTWKVPAQLLPDLTDRSGASSFREVRRWRDSLGLPERVFYRGFTLPDPLVPMSEEEQHTWTRTLARFPTSAERKPTFVDFTSVTSVRAWQRTLRRGQGHMTFQECLPTVDDAPREHDDRFTQEFVIETTEEDR
ncbi:lanthionine biosynthesis protein [Planomonospora sphaerica]|uniref:Lanthionine biosynthesis protein n=1 Tax=Planomonospora sphaerica TaxID=161355 RepID=A0A171DKD7_9ACTN|nr:lantibiotic dehydratase [Planomonospora sphaerica]GAT69288.1 lanthionine biosynthesis protein [Planomonospora sphaerica]